MSIERGNLNNSNLNNTNVFVFQFLGTFGATLKFVVKDCDPTTGEPDTDEGYHDTYMVSNFIQLYSSFIITCRCFLLLLLLLLY